jgi:hypothetical protein
MGTDIFVKDCGHQFANGKTGIEVTLFRHKLMLTEDEAKELYGFLGGVLVQVWQRRDKEAAERPEYEAKHEAVKCEKQ